MSLLELGFQVSSRIYSGLAHTWLNLFNYSSLAHTYARAKPSPNKRVRAAQHYINIKFAL